MLCKELLLRISSLLKGPHTQKKHSIQLKLTLSSSLECSLGVHCRLKDNVNFFCSLAYTVKLFILCVCMLPDETLEQGRNV